MSTGRKQETTCSSQCELEKVRKRLSFGTKAVEGLQQAHLRFVPHGCRRFREQLQDMSVKVTTEVAEVEASKTPSDEQDQVRTHASLMMLLVVRLSCAL